MPNFKFNEPAPERLWYRPNAEDGWDADVRIGAPETGIHAYKGLEVEYVIIDSYNALVEELNKVKAENNRLKNMLRLNK